MALITFCYSIIEMEQKKQFPQDNKINKQIKHSRLVMMWRYSRYRIGKNTFFYKAKRKGKFSLLRLSLGFTLFLASYGTNEKNDMNLFSWWHYSSTDVSHFFIAGEFMMKGVIISRWNESSRRVRIERFIFRIL